MSMSVRQCELKRIKSRIKIEKTVGKPTVFNLKEVKLQIYDYFII